MSGKEQLPAWKDFDECRAYAHEKNDNFYVTAFMLECWIGVIIRRVVCEFAKEKNPKKRSFQNGGAWESWNEIFGKAQPSEWPDLLGHIIRYSQTESGGMSKYLQTALHLLYIEDKHGTPVAPHMLFPDPSKVSPAKAAAAIQYMFRRLSDWMDAVVHWKARVMYALCPKSMAGDELHNELYSVGLMQARFARLSEHSKEWWRFRHDSLASEAPPEKWRIVGVAQSNQKFGELRHPEVDGAIIHCWPLFIRHSWTDEDLRNVLKLLVKRSDLYPLRDERELSDYRATLGLRKQDSKRCKSNPEGKPEGWKVALAMRGKL